MDRKTKARLAAFGRWARDMTVFVAAFWAFTAGGWFLANAMLDAAMHEIDVQERQALNAQGREAWDKYCETVHAGLRPDDLNAFHPDNGECGQMVWEAGETP